MASGVWATGSLSAPPSSQELVYLVTGMFPHISLPLFSCPLPGKGQVPSDVTQFLKSLKSPFSLPALKNRRQPGLGAAEEIQIGHLGGLPNSAVDEICGLWGF